MAIARNAEFTYQGEADGTHEGIAEMQAIQAVTGLDLKSAIGKAVGAARKEACGRENCSGTANVTYDMKVVGSEPGAIAGMPDEDVKAPEVKVSLTCANEDCSSFYAFASHLESLGGACVEAVEAAESEVGVTIQSARTEADAVLLPAQAEADAILEPARVAAEAILGPAREQSKGILAVGHQNAAMERQAIYTQTLVDLGLQDPAQ